MTLRAPGQSAGEARGPADGYQPQLEAVRALAVTCIVITHVAFQTGRYVSGSFSAELARLDIGVALFFVLSGYLLARPWFTGPPAGRSGPRLAGYFWRRLLRLYPAYVVAVVAAVVLVPDNAGVTGADWWRQLTFTQIYGSGHLLHGLTQTWSLATEVAFYLALPWVARWARPRERRWRLRRTLARLALLEVVSLAWVALVASSTDLQQDSASTWLPAYLGWFGAGMALCALSVERERRARTSTAPRAWLDDLAASPWGCWAAAAACYLVAATPAAGPLTLDPPTGWQAVTKHVLYGATAVLVLIPLAGRGGVDGHAGRALASRPLRFVGEVSYGVFLYHLVVLDIVFRATGFRLFDGHHFLPVLALTWSGSVLVAWASYRWLERPALRRRGLVGMWSITAPSTRPSPAPETAATRAPDPR